MTDGLLTTRQVAALLGLSPESVLRRWRARELPGFRLGSNVLRFRLSDVEAYLEERRGPAPAPRVDFVTDSAHVVRRQPTRGDPR